MKHGEDRKKVGNMRSKSEERAEEARGKYHLRLYFSLEQRPRSSQSRL